MKVPAIVLTLAVLASACTARRAHTPVDRPPLDVPPAPPRVIEPAPRPEIPQPAPVPDLPEKSSAPAAKPRPAPPKENRDATGKPEPPKPEIPPVEQPPAAPATQPPAPRTTKTADAGRIRDILTKTNKMLLGIDYQKLTAERKSAYDQAKSHIEGAEAALNAQDFDLAKELTDKAEKLVRELLTR